MPHAFIGGKATLNGRAVSGEDQVAKNRRKADGAIGPIRPIRKILGAYPSYRSSWTLGRGDDRDGRADYGTRRQETNASTFKRTSG